jgi:prepilin-type N-terminal cleavage/methylation domain-containing protein
VKFFLKKKYFKAFTLVELIVAISISSILFLFLFNFIVDALDEISSSKNKTKFFANFSNFNIKMKNISEVFPKYSLLIQKNP